MTVETADALLEWVRRKLGVKALHGLGATPRRLKARVPHVRAYLTNLGEVALATSFPDWDPVRTARGRWKTWEVLELGPIQVEGRAAREKKRTFLAETNTSALNSLRETSMSFVVPTKELPPAAPHAAAAVLDDARDSRIDGGVDGALAMLSEVRSLLHELKPGNKEQAEAYFACHATVEKMRADLLRIDVLESGA